jgi:uncharacterized membrane protein YfcA
MIALLFIVAALAGAINSVAGGGSFLTLPTLLYAGVTPVIANATSTLAMWPGSLASAVAYRRELKATPVRWLLLLCAVSVVGGWVGAILLVRTSDTSFMRLLPWLMLVAAVTFSFGGRLRRPRAAPVAAAFPASAPLAAGGTTPAALRTEAAGHAQVPMVVVAALQFVLSIYGGYFGGGMGIMMLATFAVAGMIHIHEMNALKTLLGVAINGLALVTFVAKGAIAWGPGVVMMAGAIVGGYLGATVARRTDPKWVRMLVTVIAWTMTVYFFFAANGAD